jgi:hypothetical protein
MRDPTGVQEIEKMHLKGCSTLCHCNGAKCEGRGSVDPQPTSWSLGKPCFKATHERHDSWLTK